MTVAVSSGEQTLEPEPKTSGFELIFVLCAIATLILLYKRKRALLFLIEKISTGGILTGHE